VDVRGSGFHKNLVVEVFFFSAPRKFHCSKFNISKVDTRSGFVSLLNILNRRDVVPDSTPGAYTTAPDHLARGEGNSVILGALSFALQPFSAQNLALWASQFAWTPQCSRRIGTCDRGFPSGQADKSREVKAEFIFVIVSKKFTCRYNLLSKFIYF